MTSSPPSSARNGPPSGVTGIVLAGGRSTRMGEDKAALLVEGRSLLQRAVDALGQVAAEIVVVGAPGRALPPVESHLPVRTLQDPIEGEGPLAGVATGLAAAGGEVAVVVACDMPYLQPALLRLLAERAFAGATLVVPLHEGRPEVLCSAWRAEALPAVRARLDRGDRAMMSVSADVDVVLLKPDDYRRADPEGRSFVNVNTPADLDRVRRAAPPRRPRP